MAMVGKRKDFDQSLNDQHDPRGRAALLEYLYRKHYDARKIPSPSYVDIECINYKTKATTYHEAGIKVDWNGEWPRWWKTVHVTERHADNAQEMCDLKGCDISDFYDWTISNDLKSAWIVPGKHIQKKYFKLIKNREVPNGEMMYDVPLDLCIYVNLKGE